MAYEKSAEKEKKLLRFTRIPSRFPCRREKGATTNQPPPPMITNKLPMNPDGTIPNNRQKTFFRVENWNTGSFIADFATRAEAQAFAIRDARAKGCRYDHKVSRCILRGA